jgi:hypothetical protein
MKMRQELARTGASLTEDDFTTIVVSSLPVSYNSVTTSLYTSASMSKMQVSMEDINRVIEEEYTRCQIQTGSAIPQASALAIHSKGSRGGSEGSTLNKGQRKQECPRCTNPKCRKLGHKIENCWVEGGGKEGQGLKPREKGNSPPTQAKVAIGNDHAFSTVLSLKATDAEFTDGQQVKVYDSSASQHISPYHEQFVNFRDCPRQIISAANKQEIEATGMGDLIINVLRPGGVSKVRLTNILYALSIGYTLISLGQVDHASYSTIIMEGILDLVDHWDNTIIG